MISVQHSFSASKQSKMPLVTQSIAHLEALPQVITAERSFLIPQFSWDILNENLLVDLILKFQWQNYTFYGHLIDFIF